AVPASRPRASKLCRTPHAQPPLACDTIAVTRAPHIKPDKKARSPRLTGNHDNGNGNGNAFGHSKDHGKPTEIVIKQAGSSKADLRTLPQEPPVQQEREEREEPTPTPVMIEPDEPTPGDVTGQALRPHVTAPAPPTIMH